MIDFSLGNMSNAPGRLRISTLRKPSFLLFIGACLLVAVAVACGGGQTSQDGSPQQVAPLAEGEPTAPVVFPQHEEPLGTDRGGDYFAGQLVLEEGCLRAQIPTGNDDNPMVSWLLVWPSSYALEEESGIVRVVDESGQTAAQAGDYIRFNSADIPYEQRKAPEFIAGLFKHCAIPAFWVGDEVTVFDPGNEATDLRLSEPDVLFLRQETLVTTNRVFLQAAGVGELVLDGSCLRLNGRPTIIWPAGFTPHVKDSVVEVRNGAGQTIARVGDEIAGGGGYSSDGHEECPGEVFRIHSIKVLPDEEAYFPKQDGSLMDGGLPERFTGELVLNGKCLEVNLGNNQHGVRRSALLVWPSDFAVKAEDGAVEIIGATGKVVARVGDKIQGSYLKISFSQAKKHGGLAEITPACSAPYWAVGEDFASTHTR